jgi:hypothetical protein
VLEIEESGGEGGIRTLGTGVSPYNGLANSTRSLPIARNQSVTTTSGATSRAELGCSANIYAPQYAPRRAETPLLTHDDPGQVVKCGVGAMSEGLDFGSIRSSIEVEAISAVPPQSFNPTAMSRLEGRPVVRSPGQLRLHRALEEVGWTCLIAELNEAARLRHPSLTEPILITTDGTILSGFGRWRSVVFDGRPEINCIEYPLSEDESLQFILTYHQTRRGWNDFVRICLALKLELHFLQRARDNMSAGGKCKGSANLPEAQRIDVREEIAGIAAVCPRNVSNVKTILEVAHPRLKEALQNGTLKINRAIQFCKLPRAEQLEQFIRYSEENATNKVIRRSIARPKEEKTSLDVAAVLDALQQQEVRQPGSVAVRVGRQKRTVVLIGQDLFGEPHSQKELHLT